ncbi:MAG: dihydroneopterin aldolase [Myxococcales bacterium]|nr:dihydroneopterin aldolase [Myxococcales bacterium]
MTKSSGPRPATILVRGLEFQGRHGASAAERKTHRRFQVDVDLHVASLPAVHSDRLADTVDYHAVCGLIEAIGTGHTYHLIEALAGAIVAAIEERWPAVTVAIEVRKLHPPCPGNPAFTAVRLRT